MSSTMNKRNGAGLMLALLAAGVLSGPASANESKAKPEPKAEAKGGARSHLMCCANAWPNA